MRNRGDGNACPRRDIFNAGSQSYLRYPGHGVQLDFGFCGDSVILVIESRTSRVGESPLFYWFDIFEEIDEGSETKERVESAGSEPRTKQSSSGRTGRRRAYR